LTFDIEGMGALNDDIAMVEFYYRLGVRQMLIAYNLNNEAGGVVGVNGLNRFLGDGAAKVESMVAHIDYMAKLVGVEHVGIGLDYDPTTGPVLDEATSAKYWPARQYPTSITDESLPPSILPRVSEQLRSRGYGESSIQAIMSRNFMRVASQVWAG
jgi:membrane dipeptidase